LRSFINLFIDCKGIELLPFSFFTSEYNQKRQLLQWVREMPLLKEQPHALAMHFARGVDNLQDAEIARMDMLDWLSAKISDRMSGSPSQRKQTNKACLAFPARHLKRLVQIGMKVRTMNKSGRWLNEDAAYIHKVV
jgi:hypothetical protein